MAYFSDLVRDTTTTTGTGDVTVTGTAPTGRVAFGTAFTVGQLVGYTISTASGAEWETGIAPLSTSIEQCRRAGEFQRWHKGCL
jgi:hypothetical protein